MGIEPTGRNMAADYIELTRTGMATRETSVLVNLRTVAWIEPGPDGTSRIVFALGGPNAPEGAAALTLTVRESAQEIAVLAGVVGNTDREAIAQAWVDQRGRRNQLRLAEIQPIPVGRQIQNLTFDWSLCKRGLPRQQRGIVIDQPPGLFAAEQWR